MLRVSLAFCLIIIVTGCREKDGRPSAAANAGPGRTIGDLVEHFQRSGMKGTYAPGAGSIWGASDAGQYVGEEFDSTVLLFDKIERAQSWEKTGFEGKPCHRNGRFILIVRKGEERILPAFKGF